MITAHYSEVRSRKLPGETQSTTIIREVHVTNGRGRKTIKVLRGARVVSAVTEPITPAENSKIKKRKFARAERKTRRNLKRSN
jgi:hypothetical protein